MSPPTESSPAWYAGGLRFECQRCGRCCRGPGGYVWVAGDEAAALAAALGMTTARFTRRLLRRTWRGLALVDGPNGDCPLLGPEGCRAYAERPTQCRTWPWWDENLTSAEAWAAESVRCPGFGRGPLHAAAAIDAAKTKAF